MQARVIKNISNKYFVECNKEILEATPLGKIKKQGPLLVGDIVEIEKYNDKYIINKVEKRKNYLNRPRIANVDQAIIVMSCKDPDFSLTLLDRLNFNVSYHGIEPVICISKMDLLSDDELSSIQTIVDDYRNNGYQVAMINKDDVSELMPLLPNKISVLCGQSGAGKSTLLNKLKPELELKTQITSKALGRGKHTTRHCELFEINNGWIADTPGFSSLEFNMDIQKLAESIKEFKPYIGECKFNDCLHIHEPGCAIKEAVENNEISKYRYDSYIKLVEYIKNNNFRR